MLLQDYLRNGGSPAQLHHDLHIDIRPSERLPGLILFKYDQIESPMGNPLVQECRGVILDSNDNWNIVARPFDKFFNYGEGHAQSIDWGSARVQEKVDGSLMTLYHFNGEWHVASSGNPDAAGQVNDFNFTFRELFWKTWDQMGFPMDILDEECTYMFELTTPYNRVVVPHKECKLTLIGVRVIKGYDWTKDDRVGGEDEVRFYTEFNPVREFTLASIDGVMETFAVLDPLHQEGYVIVDKDFNRIKVKHPGYVALHHMKDSLGSSLKRLVEIVRTGESDEFLTYFPEYREQYEDIKDRYEKLVEPLDAQYEILFDAANGNKGKVNRKAFAEEATKLPLPDFFFKKLDGRAETAKQYIATMQIDHLCKVLRIYE